MPAPVHTRCLVVSWVVGGEAEIPHVGLAQALGTLTLPSPLPRCSIRTETGDPTTCSPQGELLEPEPLVELLRERLPLRLPLRLLSASQSSMAEMSSSSRVSLRTRRTALSGRISFGTTPDAGARGTCQS